MKKKVNREYEFTPGQVTVDHQLCLRVNEDQKMMWYSKHLVSWIENHNWLTKFWWRINWWIVMFNWIGKRIYHSKGYLWRIRKGSMHNSRFTISNSNTKKFSKRISNWKNQMGHQSFSWLRKLDWQTFRWIASTEKFHSSCKQNWIIN